MRDLGRIPVVAAFLERRRRVLLLRRSERVGTYRGRWAGVSGYVERVPLRQALVELVEETGLHEDQVRLRGVGVPVRVNDEAEGRFWLVYPFLFALRAGGEPRPDWETAEARWLRPEQVRGLETVPGLAEVIGRVWPPFGSKSLWQAARRIAGSFSAGATGLALEALDAFEQFSRTRRAQKAPESLVRAARGLSALRPSMAVIPHVLARTLADGGDADGIRSELTAASERCAEVAAEALRSARCVVTHSAGTVSEQTLERWAGLGGRREAIVTESQPMREGASLAMRLAAREVKTRLITDAQMGLAVQEADAALVGADAITDDSEVLNKAGTRLLVLAAREAGKPVYGACQTHKIAPPGWPLALERQDPEAILLDDFPGLPRRAPLRADNTVFDATPMAWFTAVLTEEGELTQETLERVRATLARSPLVPPTTA